MLLQGSPWLIQQLPCVRYELSKQEVWQSMLEWLVRKYEISEMISEDKSALWGIDNAKHMRLHSYRSTEWPLQHAWRLLLANVVRVRTVASVARLVLELISAYAITLRSSLVISLI